MSYRLTRRFLPRRLSNRLGRLGLPGFRTCIAGFLIFCVCASLLTPERGASAQGECQVGCAATAPPTAQIGAQVSFMATATVGACASGPTYEWDFGDGTSTSLQQNATHTYTAPGVYTWKLTTTARLGVTTINTVAGGYGENAPARQAPFTTPAAIARDPQGRGFYVADDLFGVTLLRFINTGDAAAIGGKTIEAGRVRLLTGENGVPAFQEVWDVPISDYIYAIRGLATGANGDLLYFSDETNGYIWVYNVSDHDQNVDGRVLKPGNAGALVSTPGGVLGDVAAHPASGEVYFISGNIVYKIGPGAQPVAVAGNGATTNASEKFPPNPVDGTAAPLLTPRGVAFDNAGNLFIADSGHGRVVKLDSANKLSLVFQFQFGAGAPNPYPSGIAVIGDKVYTANGNDQTITQLPGGAVVAGKSKTACNYDSSSCGDGGPGADAQFNLAGSSASPPVAGIESDANGLYILDQGDSQTGRVRYLNLSAAPMTLAGVTIAPAAIDTVAGSGLVSPFDGGLAAGGSLSFPTGVAVDANNNLFIADTLAGRLRFVNRGSNVITLFPNTPARQIVQPGAIVTINKDAGVGQNDGVPVNQANFDTPQGLFVTNQGVFVADSKGGSSVDLKRSGLIRFINTSPSTVVLYPNSPSPISAPPGHIVRVAGAAAGAPGGGGIGNGGSALDARFFAPADIVVSPATGDIYVADVGNKAVRKISGANGTVISLNLPPSQYTGLGLDASGRLYIADYDQNRVLRESSAGSGQFAQLNSTPLNKPRDVAVDAGGAAYVTNGDDNRIVRISPSGVVEIFAGTTANPNVGFDGDGGPATGAKLSIIPDPVNISAIGAPTTLPATVNIAIGSGGEVVFTDTRNSRVRRIGAGSATCSKTGTITISGDNPPPTLNQITPTYAPLNGRDFTLTVTGSGFVTGSKVRWDGQDRPTNYVSSAQLIAQIPATDITSKKTVSVTVFNPAPGGGVSNSLPLVVSQPNPQPSLTALIPNEAAVGTGFTLTLAGGQFTETSVARWNGSPRPTTFISQDRLSVEIPASDVQSVGSADVTVFNPEPGGGTSGKLTFNIVADNPIPTITGASPQGIIVGGPEFTLEVRGSNFAATSKVRWNGEDRPTTYLDKTLLEAQIPAADIAGEGVANVTVFTPTPGGGVTSAVTVFVGKQAATVPATTFSGHEVSSDSIAALFGVDLATGVEAATSIPLPNSLLGTTVTIRDSAGADHPAPLFFVSPSQINFLVPNFVTGPALAIVKLNGKVAGVSEIMNRSVSPGLFSANANGQGVAAAVALCVATNGEQTFLPVSTYDQAQGRFVGVPLDLAACNGQVYLILFGSGFTTPDGVPDPTVTAKVGGLDVPVLFAGKAPAFEGLDQINIGPLPHALAGSGLVDIVISLDLQAPGGTNGPKPANTVQAHIK